MLNKDQMEVSYGYITRASQKAFCLLPLTLQPAKSLRICWAGKPWLSLKKDKAKEQTWREGTMTLEQKVGVLCPMQTLAKERESKQSERKGRQKEEESRKRRRIEVDIGSRGKREVMIGKLVPWKVNH
jgi:hypothetical protein